MRRLLGATIITSAFLACDAGPEELPNTTIQPHIDRTDGWDAAPGTGRTFILSSLAFAPEDVGFVLDSCMDDCPPNNQLAQVGRLLNDQLRQGLLGGEMMLMVEIAGIDEPFYGDDERVTFKIYGARDADDPFFPANNFKPHEPGGVCCEFKINPQDIVGVPPQARTRLRGAIRGHELVTGAGEIQMTLTMGAPPHPVVRLGRGQVRGRLEHPVVLDGAPEVRESLELVIGGAWRVDSLTSICNPFCKTTSSICPQTLPEDSTLLEFLLLMGLRLDIDLDNDGLAMVTPGPDGRVERCQDGNTAVPSPDPGAPWLCALDGRIADGISAAFAGTGVPANLVGFGP